MSREVRRVPLDFDAPLGQVWSGYVMPEHLCERRCPACEHGVAPSRAWLESIVHLLMLLPDETGAAAVRRTREVGRSVPMHPYLRAVKRRPVGRPGEDIEALTGGLAGRPPREGRHDDVDRGHAVAAILGAGGLDPETWGICETCGGEATLEVWPGQREAAEKWEATEPPAGDGWQLWNTAGDPAPCTPVFATEAELVAHLVAADGYRPEAAARLVADGGSIGSFWQMAHPGGGRGPMYDAARNADLIPFMIPARNALAGGGV
ncbi:hypothetical protein [Streptosporangium sp. NPDC002524]|uniref:hypothetical protein n=1 Tax=Streptosporangium sp. NPDC002524 TaxID=3154537 RepID=UPI00332D7193